MTVRLYSELTELPKNFLECRDRGHAWYDPRGEKAVEKAGRYYERRLHCPRCGTHKFDLLLLSGEKVQTSTYEYADGYLLKPKKGRKYSRTDVRGVALKASLAGIRGGARGNKR